MSRAARVAALGVEFEVALLDAEGVILAESNGTADGAAQRIANILRDLGRDLVRSSEIVPIEAFTNAELVSRLGAVSTAAFCETPEVTRAEAIRVAVAVIRAATDPDSPLGRHRTTRGLSALGDLQEAPA